MKKEKLVVEIGGERLDRYVSDNITGLTRSQIKDAIKKQKIRVNQKIEKPSYRLEKQDVIEIDRSNSPEKELTPEKIPLDIRYEDTELLVVNKPQGMVVHPSKNHEGHTLANALLGYAHEHGFTLPNESDYYRPGIVHRIDKDTSGLIVVAKTNRSYERLVQQIQQHKIKRYYTALVYGEITADKGTIHAPISRGIKNRLRFEVNPKGKEAITHFQVIQRFSKWTLVQLQLETGRTHQIRVHLSHIAHPIVDDPVYAANHKAQFFSQNGQLLHAHALHLCHPITGESVIIEAPLPPSFNKILEIVKRT